MKNRLLFFSAAFFAFPSTQCFADDFFGSYELNPGEAREFSSETEKPIAVKLEHELQIEQQSKCKNDCIKLASKDGSSSTSLGRYNSAVEFSFWPTGEGKVDIVVTNMEDFPIKVKVSKGESS